MRKILRDIGTIGWNIIWWNKNNIIYVLFIPKKVLTICIVLYLLVFISNKTLLSLTLSTNTLQEKKKHSIINYICFITQFIKIMIYFYVICCCFWCCYNATHIYIWNEIEGETGTVIFLINLIWSWKIKYMIIIIELDLNSNLSCSSSNKIQTGNNRMLHT